MADTVCAKFVSKKIRKVRWQPPAAFGCPNPEYFIIGSWDDEVRVFNVNVDLLCKLNGKCSFSRKMKYHYGTPIFQVER